METETQTQTAAMEIEQSGTVLPKIYKFIVGQTKHHLFYIDENACEQFHLFDKLQQYPPNDKVEFDLSSFIDETKFKELCQDKNYFEVEVENDEVTFVLSREQVCLCETLKNMLDCIFDCNVLYLPNMIDVPTFVKVVEFMNYYLSLLERAKKQNDGVPLLEEDLKSSVNKNDSEAIKELKNIFQHTTAIPLTEWQLKFCDVPVEFWYADDESVDLSLKPFPNTTSMVAVSSYLSFQAMYFVTGHYMAHLMRGKTPDEIRELFHLKNDLTKDDMDALKKEHAWTESNDQQ